MNAAYQDGCERARCSGSLLTSLDGAQSGIERESGLGLREKCICLLGQWLDSSFWCVTDREIGIPQVGGTTKISRKNNNTDEKKSDSETKELLRYISKLAGGPNEVAFGEKTCEVCLAVR